MKTIMKGAMRDQKGAVLISVLLLLVVGGLIVPPLLGLMSTGLMSGQVYETKMHEYYAADAGIELGKLAVLNGTVETFELNRSDVEVLIEEQPFDANKWDAFDLAEEYRVFRINSIASFIGHDSSTTVECYYAIVPKSTCIPDPDLPGEGSEWVDYSGGNIQGDVYVKFEEGGTVDGNIQEGAHVWTDGDLNMGSHSIQTNCVVNVNGNFQGDCHQYSSELYVFGDCTLGGNIQDGSMVYVSGNLTLNGSIQNSQVYVGGNLIGSESTNIQGSTVYVGADLTIGGSIDSSSIVMVENDLVASGKIISSCYYYYGVTLDVEEVEEGATQMTEAEMLVEKAALEEDLNNLLCPLEIVVIIAGDPVTLTLDIT